MAALRKHNTFCLLVRRNAIARERCAMCVCVTHVFSHMDYFYGEEDDHMRCVRRLRCYQTLTKFIRRRWWANSELCVTRQYLFFKLA